MSTSAPPAGGVAVAPPRPTVLPNEEALRSAFLQAYPTLEADARRRLGPAAATLSHRVVETAFLHAWKERDEIGSDDELRVFLAEEVQHGAARTLSRRVAAGRLGGHEGKAHAVPHAAMPTDAVQAWEHLRHALHGGEHRSEALAEATARSRHEAAQHIKVLSKRTPTWVWALAIAVFLAAFGAIAILMNRAGEAARVQRALGSTDARSVSTPYGKLGSVTLLDSTAVRLAPDSKLTIPSEFGPALRAVRLDGAATFDVRPAEIVGALEVHAGGAVIGATETSFTVRAYPDDRTVGVVVREGSVVVRRGEESRAVAAGEGVVVSEGEILRPANDAERDAIAGWSGGMLTVDERPLRDVLPLLKRWYGLSVFAENDSLLSRSTTVRASLDSTMQAIRAIEASTGLEFGYVGKNMVFRARSEGTAGRAARR